MRQVSLTVMQAKVSTASVIPPAQSEDDTLMAAIVRRQPDALEQLYDQYQTMVYHLALTWQSGA
jgi:hypothetical protein